MRQRLSILVVLFMGFTILLVGCATAGQPPPGAAPGTPSALGTQGPASVDTPTSGKEALQGMMKQMNDLQGNPVELLPLMTGTMKTMSDEMTTLETSSNTRNSRVGERMDDIGGRMGEMAQMTPRFEQLSPQTRQEIQGYMERLSKDMRAVHDQVGSANPEQTRASLESLVTATNNLADVVPLLTQDPSTMDPEKQQEYNDALNSVKDALAKMDANSK